MKSLLRWFFGGDGDEAALLDHVPAKKPSKKAANRHADALLRAAERHGKAFLCAGENMPREVFVTNGVAKIVGTNVTSLPAAQRRERPTQSGPGTSDEPPVTRSAAAPTSRGAKT